MEELKEVFQNLSEINRQSLKKEGVQFNFEDIYPQISEIFEFMDKLKVNVGFWNMLHQNKKNLVVQILKQFSQTILEIDKFDAITTPNPVGEKKRLEDQIKEIYDQISGDIFNRFFRYSSQKESSSKSLKEQQKQVREMLNFLKKKQEEAQNIVDVTKDAASITGVTKFSKIFSDEAKENKSVARKWLWASGIGAVIIGGYLSFVFYILMESLKDGDKLGLIFQSFLTKLLIFSFLSFIFYQLVKNFYANMHLHTINKHRANSLNTFEAFTKSAKSDKVSDAVLLQATKAIFEPGSSGYISQKGEHSSITDLLRVFEQNEK